MQSSNVQFSRKKKKYEVESIKSTINKSKDNISPKFSSRIISRAREVRGESEIERERGKDGDSSKLHLK